MKQLFNYLTCFFIVLSLQAIGQTTYKLVPMPTTEKTCPSYQLTKNGTVLTLSEELEEAMDCPDVLDLHDNRYLIYDNGEEEIKKYDIETGKSETILKYPEDLDAVCGPIWSPDGKWIMFVAINEEKTFGYKEITRVILLDPNGFGALRKKKEFDVPVNYDCKKGCKAVIGKDFLFENATTIQYKRHLKAKVNAGKMEKIKL
ncbi:MAG: hypothetical protein ACKVTZ_11330 [Bacteroidia bacterium]